MFADHGGEIVVGRRRDGAQVDQELAAGGEYVSRAHQDAVVIADCRPVDVETRHRSEVQRQDVERQLTDAGAAGRQHAPGCRDHVGDKARARQRAAIAQNDRRVGQRTVQHEGPAGHRCRPGIGVGARQRLGSARDRDAAGAADRAGEGVGRIGQGEGLRTQRDLARSGKTLDRRAAIRHRYVEDPVVDDAARRRDRAAADERQRAADGGGAGIGVGAGQQDCAAPGRRQARAGHGFGDRAGEQARPAGLVDLQGVLQVDVVGDLDSVGQADLGIEDMDLAGAERAGHHRIDAAAIDVNVRCERGAIVSAEDEFAGAAAPVHV